MEKIKEINLCLVGLKVGLRVKLKGKKLLFLNICNKIIKSHLKKGNTISTFYHDCIELVIFY